MHRLGATILGLLVCLVCESQAYQWNSPSQGEQILYACVGKKVTLPFEFTVEESEKVLFIRWTFDGLFKSQSIASFTPFPENFNPADEYGNRVTQVGTAGIALEKVTLEDNGNYTVEIGGLDTSGGYFTLLGNAFLQVTDKLLTRGQRVMVTQAQEAVRDKDTGKWSVALACGTFTTIGTPPFPVYWTTPSGDVIQESTYYKDNNYLLVLPNPVKGGNYSCQIPELYFEDACLNAEAENNVEDTVVVDEVLARLSLLEANQEDVHVKVSQKSEELTRRLAEVLQEVTTSLAQNKETVFNELDLRAKGSVYVRWGSTTCPNQTETIYSGYLGGSHANHEGGGSNLLCLPPNPVYDDLENPSCGAAYVYGGEYEVCGQPGHDRDIVCALCRSQRSSSVMFPATTVCPHNWTMEYTGHIMSSHYNLQSSDYVCVDDSLQGRPGEDGDRDGVRLYYAVSYCGSLACPPYQNNKILTCVVCSL